MRMIRAASITCAVVFTASLLLARVHPFGDASLHASGTALRPIHPSSHISEADLVGLTRWTHASPLFEDGSSGGASGSGDATRGAAAFQKRCSGCHSLEQSREGPNLGGVFGRTSGAVAEYDYSTALKKAHVVWDEPTLDRWLADPDAFVPGNNMDFQLVNPQERRDVIQFFKAGAGK